MKTHSYQLFMNQIFVDFRIVFSLDSHTKYTLHFHDA